MRIYIAAPWIRKDDAKIVKQQLEQAGFTVTSRWIAFHCDNSAYEHPDGVMQLEAQNNVEDLRNSDALLYMRWEKSEGKATELGIALMLGLKVFVVGGRHDNVFLHMPEVLVVNTVEQFIEEHTR